MDEQRLGGIFAQQIIAQQYRLDAYSREELIKIYMALNEAQKGILRRWDVSISTEWSKTRAFTQVKEARAIMDAIKPQVGESLAAMLGKASASSSRAYSDMLGFGGKAKGVVPAVLSAEQMRAFWQKTPVGGHLLNDWVHRVFDGPTVDAIQRQVFAGMFEGAGFREMAARLRDGFVVSKREAETLVQTYVQTANIHAMEEVYKRNRDIIAGVRWLTAFDKRTCLRCAALSGKLYPLDSHPPCPLHPRCRCSLIPETDINKLKIQPKVAEDWAKGLKKKPPGLETVLTPDGIPKTDFRRWIMAQPQKDQLAFFGKMRYGLIKDGKIGWDDLFEELTDKDGRENVRLRLLPELLGDRVVAHRALDKANVNADRILKQKQKARDDLDLDRHKAMAAGLDEAAMKKALRDAARAAKLLAAGEAATAMTIGGKAIEKIVRGSGLLAEDYELEGVVFGPVGEEGKGFMATDLFHKVKTPVKEEWRKGGLITLSDQPRKGDWIPAQGVLNALKKIHEGVPLELVDEASLQALYHEILHTRQQWLFKHALKDGLPNKRRVLLETVNEWIARRKYHELLQKLGRESILKGEGLTKTGYGYPDYVKNFDVLLEQLGITDRKSLEKLLEGLSGINETQEVATFNKQVSTLLKGMAKADPEQKLKRPLVALLGHLNSKKIERWFK